MQTIPKNGTTFSAPHEHAGELFVKYVRKRHPKNTAKLLARDAGCGVHTAEAWLKTERLPGNKHLFRLMEVYGDDFIAALLRSVGKKLATKQTVNARLQQLSRDINELKELSRQPRG